jgi:hypothetical protein
MTAANSLQPVDRAAFLTGRSAGGNEGQSLSLPLILVTVMRLRRAGSISNCLIAFSIA